MNPVELLRDRLGDLTHLLDDSALTRGIYSSDASLYRVPPLVVARPENRDQLITLVRAALECRLPVTVRGAGTSCAGNAVGAGLVIDVAKHLNRIHVVDERTRTAVIDPGVVQETLQRAAAPHGLRLGPDPSTSSRCTVGGMIGNNACGPRALGYGRMSDNVVELEIIDGHGQLRVLGRDDFPELRSLVMAHLGVIRTEFGRFSRQVSGYSMEHLLPEKKFDVAKFFAGTEGTLGIITRATVRLTPDPSHRLMVALGYPSMDRAGDDISRLLKFHPTACEGLDRRIVDVVIRKRGADSVGRLPAGEGWMFVELAGEDPAEIRNRAEALLAEADTRAGWIVEDQEQAASLWKLRADGAGLAGVSLDKPAYGSWEDAAVPPEHLGDYLRDFETLLARHGLHSLPYGHFGDGCVHARIDFPFEAPDGRARYRAFMLEAAEMVASHGGSMSGEHGDGRARSELLPRMYSPEALKLFGAVKHLFDPENLLNPGVLVDPEPTDSNLRMVAATVSPLNLEDPEFVARVHQCSGVGKCLSDTTASGGVMCPSYQATRDEKDSTRGRARALQEMVNGSLITGGWRSREVAEALDLCLSCKGCSRDCPTGIDMAAYKSRVTHERLKGRLRPRNHYSLGWLPRWGRLITKLPGIGPLINVVGAAPGLGSLMKWAAGVDGRRQIPRFASRSARRRTTLPEGGGKGPVLIWVDSFSDCFESNSFAAVVQVLARLGYAPRALNEKACCGLTWISTGQLDGARHQLRHAAAVLAPFVEQGIPIVGVEPSCTSVWRSDAPELLPGDTNVKALKGKVLTLAEFLAKDPDFLPPDLSGHTIVAQPHCHHASVIGWQADRALLKATGAELVQVGGCCGLAGNFGVEIGHHEVSVKVFEHDLGPAVTANPEAIVLADGFSCQTQLKGLAGRDSMSLAELLATHPARSA
ncbi:FAD-binding oxidoreductase [Arachnia propionica]|uniref:FAD-binding oxidoreductase n=1 Tax=Arachnia propionica TaxID=1750 RepID=A0AB37HXN2_9ACTN|nr:FAD-binding and (Fe-S)-binding domain-containing protein [Arachnia propionica]AFN47437.1 FAD linked oxidase, C-terminal domain protein [Arachnia propionica F0230a]QCT38103.1 FAD-binding oxidoreductase [Arachnia propionica]QUC12315.1 FAD-binding oxidoreductase [Arachnia propionica]RPA19113.1 FAD-binding oxidoreductase [Arachnia propionica]